MANLIWKAAHIDGGSYGVAFNVKMPQWFDMSLLKLKFSTIFFKSQHTCKNSKRFASINLG